MIPLSRRRKRRMVGRLNITQLLNIVVVRRIG